MFTSNISECNTPEGHLGNIVAARFFARILGGIKPEHAVVDVHMKTSDWPNRGAIGRLIINFAKARSVTVHITFNDKAFEIDGRTYGIDTPIPILQILGVVVPV